MAQLRMIVRTKAAFQCREALTALDVHRAALVLRCSKRQCGLTDAAFPNPEAHSEPTICVF